MTAPTSREAYEQRFKASHKITGYGIANVRIHMPCPFCAAPDWIVCGFLEVEAGYAAGAKCEECGRTARAIYIRQANGCSIEMVQTEGDLPDEWIPVRYAQPGDFDQAPIVRVLEGSTVRVLSDEEAAALPVVNTEIMATVPEAEERAPETQPSPSST